MAIEPSGSMSRHRFSCVVTWFLVLSYGKRCNIAFLCCDMITGSLSLQCHDRDFMCCDQDSHDKRSC